MSSLTGPSGTTALAAQLGKPTLADLTAMPKQTQLLLAHILEQNNPELMVFENDSDAQELCSTGWLRALPCSTVGFISFKINQHCWRQLSLLRTQFLTGDLLSALESYRKRNSTLYPWNWW
jgi:hypothetical protein